MKIYIDTPRLILRDWKLEDYPAFAQLNADPEVMRYFPECLAHEVSNSYAERTAQAIREKGFGWFATEEKSSGEFIGFVGVQQLNIEVDFAPGFEIGWRLRKESWNRGYATEAAKACLSFAFQQLHQKEVYSFTATQNLPSQRVMQKIGMKEIGHFEHPKLEADSPLRRHVLYYLAADDLPSKKVS